MIHYNLWFSLRDSTSEQAETQGLATIETFLNELCDNGSIAGFQLLKNSAGSSAKTSMLPFQALIEFADNSQFSSAFAAQAARGIHNGLHGRVMALVSEFKVEVFRQLIASKAFNPAALLACEI